MDMVERVAKAIAFAEGDDYYESSRFFEKAARAAIAAMMEPSEDMLEAANEHDRGMMPWREQYQAMIRAALPSPAIDDMDRK